MTTVLWSRLRAFIPEPLHAGNREILLGCTGVMFGLMLTDWLCRGLPDAAPALISSMGASALLAFALPSSPFSRPWALIGGNTVSVLAGLGCAMLFTHNGLAAGIAVAASIIVMIALRCLHPPGGSIALAVVLGSRTTPLSGMEPLLWTVLADSVVLSLASHGFNRAFRRGHHPAVENAHPHHTHDPLPGERIGFQAADLDLALDEHGELLDVNRDDLLAVFHSAEWHAHHRRFRQVCCGDIMSRDVVRVQADTSLSEAWARLEHHRLHALPVVDPGGQLCGIVTARDILIGRQSSPDAPPANVQAVMTTRVLSVQPTQSIADLAVLLSDGHLHHLPVVDDGGRVVGMITQSDLVGALFKLRL